MDINAFYTISVLLFAWGLTCIALLRCCLKRRKRNFESPALEGQDIIYHLLSEKQNEARKSREAVRAVADALQIGLLSLKDGKPRPLNNAALPLLKEFGGIGVVNRLQRRLRDGKALVLKNEEIEQAIQCTPVKHLNQGLDLVVIQDITESFRAAKRLKQQERLALLGKLTAQMAHQIKTPLAILAGQAQMLAKKLGNSHELHSKALSIYEEAQGLAEQINGITAFYKARKPKIEEFPIEKLFDDLKGTLDKQKADCTLKFRADRHIRLLSDYIMVKSLLFLLVQNAMAPETGATIVEILAEKTDDGIKIAVKDNGEGIPDSSHKEIFEPFFSTKEDGLGLGLFLASELAHKLGASLRLESNQEGTCFTLTFEEA